MKKIITNMDRHGRVMIPSEVRKLLNIKQGDKVNLEVYTDEVKIIDANKVISQMHSIFTKNRNDRQDLIIDNSITVEKEEYQTEKTRGVKNEQ